MHVLIPYNDGSLHPAQSASQPRLSFAEMTEDYPRYPDIHEVDLSLLNPRMIVVCSDPLVPSHQYTPLLDLERNVKA